MNIEEKVKALLADFLEDEFFVVDVEYKDKGPRAKLLVWMDGDKGISIDMCAKISRFLSNEIETQDLISSSFVLEVSSPGVDTPLKLWRQYLKNQGRKLQIKTLDGNDLTGVLLEVNQEALIIEPQQKKKVKTEDKNRYTIALAEIKEAKVLVSFN